MSFWVIVQISVIMLFLAPKHGMAVKVVLLLETWGGNKINKDSPATTAVLE